MCNHRETHKVKFNVSVGYCSLFFFQLSQNESYILLFCFPFMYHVEFTEHKQSVFLQLVIDNSMYLRNIFVPTVIIEVCKIFLPKIYSKHFLNG